MADSTNSETRDYRDTVFLPKTDFPMKAGLAAKEPAILERWARIGLYERLRETRAGREKYILHDGPPYANGDIHIGHALNKLLKDLTVRFQTLKGKDAPYVPGWDCHGLPIEWKIEEAYRKKRRDKDAVDPIEFRKECRDFAAKWVEVQSAQFQRLGILGRWEKPYLTMAYEAEAVIVEEFLKVAGSGLLYRGAKPVMWSPVEQTALAEAEVEYQDIISTEIDVAFEIVEAPNAPELVGAHAVIWTTTPWTIPVNRAIAYGADIAYVAVEVDARRILVAEALVADFLSRHSGEGRDAGKVVWRGTGADLEGAVARHPLHKHGAFFAEPRPFLAGDFVETDAGTGLVHMAPDHGEDDFRLCAKHSIEPLFVVGADGRYRDDWPVVGGDHVYKVNALDGPVVSALEEAGGLLAADGNYRHSYPHSWRSKAKLIYRCTPQWFVSMDEGFDPAPTSPSPHADKASYPRRLASEASLARLKEGSSTLRDIALAEIEKTRFVPARGYNRLKSMVAGRPDWVLSRQRAWGVPLTLYVHRETGEFLQDEAVDDRIVAAVRAGGADAWFAADHQQLLGKDYSADEYEPVTDILDVWFDSGSTHAFVLESDEWPELSSPADMYLEGSDQHRGWFQSSLLESCTTRGRAPYHELLTHGMTLDKNGRKMSKSHGNTIEPKKIIDTQGADILRLWVAAVDFTEDHRIGDEIIRGISDRYRKLRNTFRYLLGALEGFEAAERVAPAAMPELERWVLHRLAVLDTELRAAIDDYDYTRYLNALETFAGADLSAFYFDVRKDSLYCDAADDPRRCACRTAMDMLFHALVRYAAPILAFTAEEVWQSRFPSEEDSVHYLEWPEIDAAWRDEALGAKWADIRRLRAAVTEAIEPLRKDKVIRSSNEADVALVVNDAGQRAAATDVNFAEVAIVSRAVIGDEAIGGAEQAEGQDVWVRVDRTRHAKCARCWRHTGDVDPASELCVRCTDVLARAEEKVPA